MSRCQLALLGALTLVSACLAAPPVQADPLEEARTLFLAGSQAYSRGRYDFAIDAFEKAYGISKRPGLLFSLAQAHRRKFVVDGATPSLEAAVKYYEEYLKLDGPRRADAEQALVELRPLAIKLKAESPAADTRPSRIKRTQLSISSPTQEARLWLDGKDRGPLPFIGDVPPGAHAIRIVAKGYQPHERKQQIPKGETLAIDVPLTELPGHVTLTAVEGAKVYLDGRFLGEAPIGPLELTPGAHFLGVSRRGSQPFARELELGRGDSLSVTADLPDTGQRWFSYGLMGLGAGGLVASGVLGGLAIVKDGEANDLQRKSQVQALTLSQVNSYRAARDDRDNLRTASFASLGVGGGLLVTGLLLYLLDEPQAQAPSLRREQRKDEKRQTPSTMEVSLLPALGTEGAALALHASF